MRLSTSEKQQIFFDSFDMFKDDWNNNADTLKDSISGVASSDIDAALQMWKYLLEHNPSKIKADSEITGGILKVMPADAYNDIAKNSYIINSIFKKSCRPWDSISLIIHFIQNNDFFTTNELYELIFLNKNVSEYNYSGYTSSNISTCLFYTLNQLYNCNENEIDFLSDWIERVDEKREKMKLKVLLLSKEKKENSSSDVDSRYNGLSNRSDKKNNYLLEDASLEDLDLASSNREKFEIKKLLEYICNGSISVIDFSKLNISWLYNIFSENPAYTEENFNIIGAYYTVKSMSWETQRLIENIYKNKMPIESLWENSYNGDTEYSINLRLQHISKAINDMMPRWNFDAMTDFSKNIISLNESYKNYLLQIQNIRENELQQYSKMLLSDIGINTRIKNLLSKRKIEKIPQLVKLIESGIHIEGIGFKSFDDICSKLSSIGISINSHFMNDDFNFIFKYLHINADANSMRGTYEITRMLEIRHQGFDWAFGRADLKQFMENQSEIAHHFIPDTTKLTNNLFDNMMQLKRDEKSIYLPGKYFFINISTDRLNI